jgi:F-type H+-transporting ATPase subunit c
MKKLVYVMPVIVALFLLSNPALADNAAAAADNGRGLIGLGAGLAIGLAALGGSIGQGNAANGALTALGRNPNANVMVPMILGLALIESLVIYGMVIGFQLVGQL